LAINLEPCAAPFGFLLPDFPLFLLLTGNDICLIYGINIMCFYE
jgi:hypothetical protein